MNLNWKLDKNKPICPQITARICVLIANGTYGPGDKLPSVREIAIDAGVNPNTVQKSIEQLESRKLIGTVRGMGSYVSDDISYAQEMVRELIGNKITSFFEEMNGMGFSKEQTKEMIRRWEDE